MSEEIYVKIKNAIVNYAIDNNIHINTITKNAVYIALIDRFYQEYKAVQDVDVILDKILMNEVIKTYIDSALEREREKEQDIRKELKKEGIKKFFEEVWINICADILIGILIILIFLTSKYWLNDKAKELISDFYNEIMTEQVEKIPENNNVNELESK